MHKLAVSERARGFATFGINITRAMPKPLIIVNHAAAKARRVWPTIRTQLVAAGIEFDVHETQRAGDATSKTRHALRDGVTTIAAVGGDGTLSEVAEGVFVVNYDDLPVAINPNAALAIFPAGTGDDFARGLAGNRAPLQFWINQFANHCNAPDNHIRKVDVLYGRCDNFSTPFICINASTMGIGGETATRVAAQGKFMRRFSGEARFAAAALVGIARWRERPVRITIDGSEVIQGEMNLAAVANGLYAGGGMMLSPDARNDDGKLDVICASGLSRIEVVRELGRIHSGGHIGNSKVRIARGTYVRIETFAPADAMPIEVDGNVRGFTPVEFRVLPAAINFVCG